MNTTMMNILSSLTFNTTEERNKFIINNFVTSSESYLNSIPVEYKTYELYRMGLSKNVEVIYQIPNKFINGELLEIALRKNYEIINHLPRKWKNLEFPQELCEEIIKYNPLYLTNIPHNNKTEKLCKLAVSLNGAAFQLLPSEFKNEEMAKIALSQCRFDNIVYENNLEDCIFNNVANEHNPEDCIFNNVANKNNLEDCVFSNIGNSKSHKQLDDLSNLVKMAGHLFTKVIENK
jgi:hypothetical protein